MALQEDSRQVEAQNTERHLDVAPLFSWLNTEVRGPMIALFNQATYEADIEHPENNWLTHAFHGFQVLQERLQTEGKKVRRFATVGTGPALDALGASMIFPDIEQIFATDSNHDVIKPARYNLSTHTSGNMASHVLEGDLCEPLRAKRVRADVLYANLPLIPGDNTHDGMRSSSFVSPELFERAPEKYKRYLLGMKHAFLKTAPDVLAPDGSVVISLGGRVPVPLIKELFDECDFDYSELWNELKPQSQPGEVLPGFAEAEERYGVEFDFYDMELTDSLLSRAEFFPIESAEHFKRVILSARMGAREALECFNDGDRIGHLVQIIRGTKKEDEEKKKKRKA